MIGTKLLHFFFILKLIYLSLVWSLLYCTLITYLLNYLQVQSLHAQTRDRHNKDVYQLSLAQPSSL